MCERLLPASWVTLGQPQRWEVPPLAGPQVSSPQSTLIYSHIPNPSDHSQLWREQGDRIVGISDEGLRTLPHFDDGLWIGRLLCGSPVLCGDLWVTTTVLISRRHVNHVMHGNHYSKLEIIWNSRLKWSWMLTFSAVLDMPLSIIKNFTTVHRWCGLVLSLLL